MDKERIVQELLHLMKAEKKGLKTYFNYITKDSKSWYPFSHGKFTEPSCYLIDERIKYLNSVLDKYSLCFEFLDINPYNLINLNKLITKLKNPEFNKEYKNFFENISEVKRIIQHYAPEVNKKIEKLTCQEIIRLDEAINCFRNFQFYASVVMSVSAVEARLHYLLKSKNKIIYKKYFEDATIGQLLKVFDENGYKDNKFKNLKKLLPQKFKPLVELLNYLRVYSAHPKSKCITFKIAQSALNLSFEFLLDDETRIEEKSLTKCK